MLSDFIKQQKDLYRGLQNDHGNYYSWLDVNPRFHDFPPFTIFDIKLYSAASCQKVLNENKHNEIEKFIVDAARFGWSLVQFLQTRSPKCDCLPTEYSLDAGLYFADVLYPDEWKRIYDFKAEETK